MTNAIKITPLFSIALQTNSWVIVNKDYLVGVYQSRQAARDAKVKDKLEGSIKNKSEVEFELVIPVAASPAALAGGKKPAKQTPKKVNVPILHKSEIDHPCKRVWGIASDMKDANPTVKRGAVLAECVAQGIAYYTARTQYQQWLGIQKEMAEREAQQAAAAK
jgi:hypothetical protein